jgi:hypothetical protein
MTHQNDLGVGGEERTRGRELILAQLTGLEARAHAEGWNEPPSLWFLRDGEPPVQAPVKIQNPAGEHLLHIAELLGRPDWVFHAALLATVALNPSAVAFVCEAWMNNTFTSEEEREKEKRALADIPTSVEIRAAIAVDLDGGTYYVSRTRGQEPESHYVAPGDTSRRTGGRVYEALKMIAELLRRTELEVTT